MATNYKDFSSKKGLVAEDGAITSKKEHGIVLQNNSNNTVTIKPAGTTADYTLTLPANNGNADDFLKSDGSGGLSWASLGDIGGGTVTSVDITVPTGLTVSGAPVTTSGTFAVGLDTGYVIPTTAALAAKLESGDIANKIELTDLSAAVAAANGNGNFAYDNTSGVFTYTPPDLSAYLTSVVEDTTPQLGGNLDTNNNRIFNDSGTLEFGKYGGTLTSGQDAGNTWIAFGNGTQGTGSFKVEVPNEGGSPDSLISAYGNGSVYINAFSGQNVALNAYGGGDVTIRGLAYPAADGTNGQVMTTDGTGSLSFTSIPEETVTSLALVGDTLTYTDENGNGTNIDLSAYLDEDARAIASGVLDAGTGIVTFTRDDATTFTLNLSALLDDTNLVTSVAGKSGVVTLVKADITDFSDADYATAAQGSTADSAVQPGDNVSDLTNDAGYITSYTETDTLDSVTGRGDTTTNDISVGEVTTTGGSNSATLTSDLTFTGDAAKIMVLVVDGTSRTATELLVTHDGTDVYITEYATIHTFFNMITSVTGSVTGGTVTISITGNGTVKASTIYVA